MWFLISLSNGWTKRRRIGGEERNHYSQLSFTERIFPTSKPIYVRLLEQYKDGGKSISFVMMQIIPKYLKPSLLNLFPPPPFYAHTMQKHISQVTFYSGPIKYKLLFSLLCLFPCVSWGSHCFWLPGILNWSQIWPKRCSKQTHKNRIINNAISLSPSVWVSYFVPDFQTSLIGTDYFKFDHFAKTRIGAEITL